MSTIDTDDLATRLDHVRALREAATPGRYMTHSDLPRAVVACADPDLSLLGVDRAGVAIVWRQADADFFAAAPTMAALCDDLAARLAEVEQERDQYRADSIALRRAEGALVDAGPGDTGSAEAGILALAAERDEAVRESVLLQRAICLALGDQEPHRGDRLRAALVTVEEGCGAGVLAAAREAGRRQERADVVAFALARMRRHLAICAPGRADVAVVARSSALEASAIAQLVTDGAHVGAAKEATDGAD